MWISQYSSRSMSCQSLFLPDCEGFFSSFFGFSFVGSFLLLRTPRNGRCTSSKPSELFMRRSTELPSYSWASMGLLIFGNKPILSFSMGSFPLSYTTNFSSMAYWCSIPRMLSSSDFRYLIGFKIELFSESRFSSCCSASFSNSTLRSSCSG